MLTILEAEFPPSPSRAWAEAAWRNNPTLAPNWWRENLGFTHSKVVMDARECKMLVLPDGVNVVLTAGQDFSAPRGVVRAATLANIEMFTPGCAEVLLWQVPEIFTELLALAVLTQLEQRVQRGEIEAYGVHDEALGTPLQRWPLATWLNLAAQAAEAVWGRKKRPNLKVLLVPFDAVACAPLLWPSSPLKGRDVPLLEHTAHLGLWVLALPVGLSTPPMLPEALQALAALAEAEGALHHALHGQWPHIDNKPVFTVLKHLQQGQAPWPHPAIVAGWMQHAWPALQQAFIVLSHTPQVKSWEQAWQQLRPYLYVLANAASPQALEQILSMQKKLFPPALQTLSPAHQAVALYASVPGIGAVAIPKSLACDALYHLPDIADVGPFFVGAMSVLECCQDASHKI